MEFEWSEKKAVANFQKHGISFAEAATVFGDPLAVTYFDLDHSAEEERFITFGFAKDGQLLVIAHTDRGETTRIISARRATRKERRQHEQGR